MEIVLKSGKIQRYHIPTGNFLTPQELEAGLYNGILKLLQNEFVDKRVATDNSSNIQPRKRRSNSTVSRETKETDFRRVDEPPRVPESITGTAGQERDSVTIDKQKRLIMGSKVPEISTTTEDNMGLVVKEKETVPSGKKSSKLDERNENVRTTLATSNDKAAKSKDDQKSSIDKKPHAIESLVTDFSLKKEPPAAVPPKQVEIIIDDERQAIIKSSIQKSQEGQALTVLVTDPSQKNVSPEVYKKVIDENDLIKDDIEEDPMAQTFNKESFFSEYPDLLEKFKKNPNSWNNLLGLLAEKIRRDNDTTRNETRHMIEKTKRQDRLRMASEIAVVGTKEYIDLIELVDNEEEFYKKLGSIPTPSFASKESYNKKLRKEFEKKLGLAQAVKFEYQQDLGRFALKIEDDSIEYIRLSDQICYVLGFEDGRPLNNGDIARYSCDLRGGMDDLKLV